MGKNGTTNLGVSVRNSFEPMGDLDLAGAAEIASNLRSLLTERRVWFLSEIIKGL